MKLHQYGDKIIVNELRPMSEAPRNGECFIAFSEDMEMFTEAYFDLDNGLLFAFGTIWGEEDLIGWLPMPIFQPENKSQDKAALYEKLRKLNPREFAELHERNLRGEGSFDDLVSRLP